MDLFVFVSWERLLCARWAGGGNKRNACFTSDVSMWGKNTKTNPLRPPRLFYQLKCLFRENSLPYQFSCCVSVKVCKGDSYHCCHQCVELQIGIFIDPRQPSHFGLSFGENSPTPPLLKLVSAPWSIALRCEGFEMVDKVFIPQAID